MLSYGANSLLIHVLLSLYLYLVLVLPIFIVKILTA